MYQSTYPCVTYVIEGFYSFIRLTHLVKALAYLNAIKRGEKQFGELARFESDCASHTDDGDLGKGLITNTNK